MKLKIKAGDKIRIGRRTLNVEFPRGQGRVAILEIPNGMKGRVGVIRRKRP